MAELDNIRRIIVEDYDKKDAETVGKLAGVLNHHMEQVHNAFSNRIDFKNLNQELVTFTAVVNGSGELVRSVSDTTLISSPQFSTEIVSRPVGLQVIRAINQTDSTVYPTGTPFVSFSVVEDGLMKINRISGLPAANKFFLRFLIIGE